MGMPPLSWDLPAPFVDMAVLASRFNASLVVFNEKDQVVYANNNVRSIYQFVDFSHTQTFESLLRSSWEHGTSRGLPVPQDPDAQLAYAQLRRRGERLEFVRRYPAKLICAHLRLPSGMNAQLRVEPGRAGLEHFFSDEAPTLGLMEAIRRREEAEQRAAALDCLAFGVAVVGCDCKVKHLNAAMSDLLDRHDGLRLDELGRLAALDQDDNAALARLMIMASANKLPAPTVALQIHGAAVGQSHTLSVSRGADASGSAVVIVAPARLDVLSVSTVLRRDYGLTPAEAGLAAMIGNGFTNEEVAKETGKASGTGRLQVSSILKKLDRGELANRGQTGLARWVAVLGAITGAARTSGK